MQKLRVNEIYQTFSGEGPNAGDMTTFIRFSGCNLRCPGWGVKTTLPSGEEVVGCDTPHAVFPELYLGDPKYTAEELLEKIPSYPQRVTLTGGEPFLQPREELNKLVIELLKEGHTIDVFTNGTLDYQPSYRWINIPTVTMCVDYKLPGSGEYGKFLYSNCWCLEWKDEVKFVIRDEQDYEQAKSAMRMFDGRVRHSIGPVWGEMDPSQLIAWIMRDKLRVRLNLQTHQLIGVNETEREWHFG